MNQEIKARWIAALRSGKFKQGRGSLSRNGAYCCLGVLCEVAVEDGIVYRNVGSTGSVAYHSFYDNDDWSLADLPRSVQQWAELVKKNPPLSDESGEVFSASTWNDSFNASFNRIADLIEVSL